MLQGRESGLAFSHLYRPNQGTASKVPYRMGSAARRNTSIRLTCSGPLFRLWKTQAVQCDGDARPELAAGMIPGGNSHGVEYHGHVLRDLPRPRSLTTGQHARNGIPIVPGEEARLVREAEGLPIDQIPALQQVWEVLLDPPD